MKHAEPSRRTAGIPPQQQAPVHALERRPWVLPHARFSSTVRDRTVLARFPQREGVIGKLKNPLRPEAEAPWGCWPAGRTAGFGGMLDPANCAARYDTTMPNQTA
jgi:hypothetical protein